MEQVRAIRAAAERWTAVIVGDKPDLEIPTDYQVPSHCERVETVSPGTIDDLRITIRMHPAGDGQSRVCELDSSSGSGRPVWVYFGLDENWLRAPFESVFEDMMTHHFGHLLGFGYSGSWASHVRNRTRVEGPGADTHFADSATVAAFDAVGGADWIGGSKVPVENTPLRGIDSHWRQGVFGNEVMTAPWPTWRSKVPLSAVTVQSIATLGYEVDVTMADPYTLPATGALVESDVEPPGPGDWCFHGGPAELIYDRGRVVGMVHR
jgi:hypothetical protein